MGMRVLATLLGLFMALALVPSATAVASDTDTQSVRALIVRYAPGVDPGTRLAPTGRGHVAKPLRGILRLGEPLGERMYTIRLTRPITAAEARRVCRQLTGSPRIQWAQPDVASGPAQA